MAGERVLIVEDNEMNMKLFRDVLLANGYRTLEATTGAQAFPDLDGADVLRRLRADERTSSLTVLALTAQAMHGDRVRFLTAGFDGYLSKPVDVRELIGTVREHCDRLAG